jgi:D-3-phosphoglycerate dehydrogenase
MAGVIVAVSDSPFPSLEPAKQVLAELNAEVRQASAPTAEAILDIARDADALMVTYATITGDMMRQLSRCRIIARMGLGLDNLDLDAATECGIPVTNVPDYCIDEVSDHALALLMALARKIPLANNSVHNGTWDISPLVPVHRLRGQTLGLIGFGKIPQALAPKAQALGLSVIASDPYVPTAAMAAVGVSAVSLDELLSSSDYISIHAPLTPATHHMLDSAAFAKMKRGTLLINTARGPLVDPDALIDALDSGRLAGAALDVLTQEPPLAGSRLMGRDDLILTPHMAFYSVEALEDLETKAAQEVVRVFRGQPLHALVNHDVLSRW